MNSPAPNPATSSTPHPWPYHAISGHYDELLDPSGATRPAWQKLMQELTNVGAAEISERWEQTRRFIHENGVTYNVYGDQSGMYRPWQLDAVPMMISSQEWTSIEQAVSQRATLLNQVIADAYGDQRLIKENHLPPELILANPGFLRPACGIAVRNNLWLHIYAADLARAPNGQWWVINDRTQTPSGAGYALENRIVLTRMFPEVFERCHVHRLAEYFRTLRTTLNQLAPAHLENPRIVLLTPGPHNETYFEHAYLARYLNFPLVEGSDLTVRDRHVFLKTLSGLLPVDVILRRLDDSFCDPLELRNESLLGVPGLLDAVRAGHVVVSNALGTGIAETSGLQPFLPGLCKILLGEDLKMPSVATWWCGQASARRDAFAQLDNLIVKKTFAADGHHVIFTNTQTAEQRAELQQQIEREPYRYIAQERVPLSTAPVWENGAVQPRHLMLRVYAAARPDGSYAVMPGGLTRVGGSADSTLVSTQSGGGSKDTWVLADGPISQLTLLPAGGYAQRLTRDGFILSSRVADNLFWLGKYLERIEAGVRAARCLVGHMADPSGLFDQSLLPDLARLLAELGQATPPGGTPRARKTAAVSFTKTVAPLLFHDTNNTSIRADIDRVYRIGFSVRDRISLDAWRILTRLRDRFARPTHESNETLDLLNDTILILDACSGQAGEGMTREKGWRFLDIGRRISRSLSLLKLLEFGLSHADSHEPQRLTAILEIANSLMTYRSRYGATTEPTAVLDLLMLDESNPRSLTFQLTQIQKHLEQIAPPTPASQRPAELRIAMGLLATTQLAEIEQIVSTITRSRRTALIRLLSQMEDEFDALSTALTHTYLSHAQTPRPLASFGIGSIS